MARLRQLVGSKYSSGACKDTVCATWDPILSQSWKLTWIDAFTVLYGHLYFPSFPSAFNFALGFVV